MAAGTRSLDELPPLVYSPLPTPSSFRILDLCPGESHEHIRCKLRFVDLEVEESTAFVGLS